MSNIIKDIVEEIEIKPNKTKLVIKWIISLSATLITLAFVFGQFKSSFFSRMDKFEETLNNNIKATTEIKNEMSAGFSGVNARIDKVYSDGYKAFDDYQRFNKAQLILVLDYGQTNKELLKKMLELNMQEKSKTVESQLEQAKTESVVPPNPELSISIRQNNVSVGNNYISLVSFVNSQGDTLYQLTGATKEYIEKINRNRYNVGQMIQNQTNPRLFDVTYITK
jgi:hypothetical protein